MKYYKTLNTDRSCFHGGMGTWEPEGVPMPRIEGELVACENGYHVCTLEDLIDWLAPAIWEVEIDTEGIVDAGNKSVVRSATLSRRTAWDMERMVAFALDCAEHVQHLSGPEVASLNAMTRRYVAGTATEDELSAARDAARDASDASDAASAASYAASAARNAASYAASDARNAASAARYTARYAARAARYSASYAAEQTWQTNKLVTYL